MPDSLLPESPLTCPGATKVVYLARRNPRLSQDEFPARWRQHSQLAATMPSIRPGFVQVAQCINAYDRTAVPRASLEYDGVNLLTLANEAFATAIWQSDEVQELILPDELQTFDRYVRHVSLIAREHVVTAGPMTPFCLLYFLKRDRSLSEDVFIDALCQMHGQLGQTVGRAVVNRIVDRPPGLNFDAVTELWLPDADAAASLLASPRYIETYLPDRLRIADEMRTLTMWTRVSYARPAIGE